MAILRIFVALLAALSLCASAQSPAAGERAAQIASAATFRTLGLDRAGAEAYLSTADGAVMLVVLKAADPGASVDVIYRRALDQLGTGSAPPRRQSTIYPVIKLVPHGQSVSPYSPYFTIPSELIAAKLSRHSVANYFGLPMRSQAPRYDVYRISPVTKAVVFISRVAPTEELGGEVRRPGGGIQYLVPDRGKWSQPELIGNIDD